MDDTREEDVTVYLTTEEKRKIRQEAAKNGQQMSAYMRQKSLPKEQTAEATA